MSGNEAVPDRLYKYRGFGKRTVRTLVDDQLWFADPRDFNDPLECRPYVDLDVDESVLETTLRRLVEQRVTAEMRATSRTMGVPRTRADAHIEQMSRRQAEDEIADVKYHATNPDYDNEVDVMRHLLRDRITSEVLRRHDRGIVSLAEHPDCPLMWSHYGDGHRGICVGYSVPAEANVRRVRYDGGRRIAASKVAAMVLEGDKAARHEVDEAVLLRKAPSWGYEREWRLLGPRELNSSPLELEEVVFGVRCDVTVKYAVMKALECRERRPRFRELHEKPGEFDLAMACLSYDDEMFRHFPIRFLSIIEGFEVSPDGGDGSTE